jgi:hypothetical protein
MAIGFHLIIMIRDQLLEILKENEANVRFVDNKMASMRRPLAYKFRRWLARLNSLLMPPATSSHEHIYLSIPYLMKYLRKHFVTAR